ncbi:MAG: DUF2520 domain-containing protein [Deltaproteobacteria bacterium]|nr:MAG: DUF2520 domain-containing protein [Deltaproteobacteria bacterium]
MRMVSEKGGKMEKDKIAVVGAGVVGTALAYLLKEKGYRIIGIASRSQNSAQRAASFLGGEVRVSTTPEEIVQEADLVFITTSDSAIEEVCERIANKEGFRPGQIVVHTSGALPSTILLKAREKGALIASVHPLQSFADVKEAIKIIPSSIFCLEGAAEAIPTLMELVRTLGARPFSIDTRYKSLYHAAAVVASNFLVTLYYLSFKLYEAIDIPREEASQALLPLIKGTVNNIEKLGPVKALTGPIARGDLNVVKGHLEALRHLDTRFIDIYRTISRLTVEIGIKKGTLSPEKGDEILRILDK